MPWKLAVFATTPLELLSFLLSVATVWFNIRQSHWGWLFAIISSATYGLVFFGSRLYGDMGLQLVFIAVSIFGWYQWLHGDDSHERCPSRRSRARPLPRGCSLAGRFCRAGVVPQDLHRYRCAEFGRLPDGRQLVGQLLLSRKKIENWHVWIIVDVLYVALYLHKHLMLTAILYAVFVGMAVMGLRAWSGDVPANGRMALE
jgi:nicotinamide mononucleotide transporter